MDNNVPQRDPRILLITTAGCSYLGADTVGQMHLSYSPNTYVMRIPDPVMLPPDFYLYCLERGMDGIVVMSAGAESPFEGTYEKLAGRMDALRAILISRGIDYRRIKLAAICSVCSASFLKEVRLMTEVIAELGLFDPEVAAANAAPTQK